MNVYMLSIYRIFTSTSPETNYENTFTRSFASFTFEINIFENNTEFNIIKESFHHL